jgi:peptidoglycan/LPS O-acetylase OafA/YrhL
VDEAKTEDGERGRGARDRLETGYPGLDLIRFAAALMVALYHFTLIGPARTGKAGAAFLADFAQLQPLTSAFWVAVPIFFVLSGIVIAFSAEGRSAGEFLRRRALRLYPAAWICASVTLLLLWTRPEFVPDGAELGGRYLRSLTLFPAGPWISDVYWTLAVEVTFYAMVAIALAIGGSRWVTGLGAALAISSSAWWGLRIGNMLAGDLLRPALDRVQLADPFLLLSNGCYFALGILAFAIASERRPRWVALLAGMSALASFVAVLSTARGFAVTEGSAARPLLVAPAIWLIAVAAMAAELLLRSRKPLMSDRRVRAARALGLATYPLYLVHAEVGMALMLLLAPLGPWTALPLAVAGVLAAVALIARAEGWIRRPLARIRRGG